MMKATIKFKEYGKMRQKTMAVEKNEPNSIIVEFHKAGIISKYTYIDTVKCGRTIYEWKGIAQEAGIY